VKSKPTFQAAYSAAGWEKHPDAVGWYYNESTGEQLDDEDLKAALGF
jgi:hypothetical protein